MTLDLPMRPAMGAVTEVYPRLMRAISTAKTTYGTIGVKVWIFKGEVVAARPGATYSSGQ